MQAEPAPSRAGSLPQMDRGTSGRSRSAVRPPSRASPLPHWTGVQPGETGRLQGRLREQARSHKWIGYIREKQVGCQAAFASRLAPTVGPGYSRERQVGCQAAFASKPAPTVGPGYSRERQVGCKAASRASFAPTDPAQTDLRAVRPGEPGRLSGRLASAFDLGAPLTTMAERRHCGVGIPAWMPG